MTLTYDPYVAGLNEQELIFAYNLDQALTLIDNITDFAFFDMNLSKKIYEEFSKIDKTKQFFSYSCLNCKKVDVHYAKTYFANLDSKGFSSKITTLQEAIQSLTEEETITNGIINILDDLGGQVKYALGDKDSYIFIKFVVRPEGKLDDSWHFDNIFRPMNLRVLIPFIGNPTEFYQALPYEKEEIQKFTYSKNKSSHPNPFAKMDLQKVAKPSYGQGIIYSNDGENIALHRGANSLNSKRSLVIYNVCSAERIERLYKEFVGNSSILAQVIETDFTPNFY